MNFPKKIMRNKETGGEQYNFPTANHAVKAADRNGDPGSYPDADLPHKGAEGSEKDQPGKTEQSADL